MDIIVSNSATEPIYQQIASQIRAQILSGELREGDPLPSIRTLARDLRISVITTRRAYEELERDGFVDTVTGKGTFVARQSEEYLAEMRLRRVEERLEEAVSEARMLSIPLSRLREMLEILYEEDGK